MAGTNGRTPEIVRSEIAVERDQLAAAVEALRAEVGQATDVTARLRSRLPAATAGAFGLGFVLFGGVGATMRLLARRSRER